MRLLRAIQRWFDRGSYVGEHLDTYKLNEVEARTIAGQWASARNLKWSEPSAARRGREGEPRVWYVQSNATGKGHSISVQIDDDTGCVIDHDVLPR